jgi:hypothetical protein
MGTFSDVLASRGITDKQLFWRSQSLEGAADPDRELHRQRREARGKGQGGKYEGVAKPASGRGLSRKQIQAALEDRPLPRKARSKLLRAVNAEIEKKKGEKVDTRGLFGTVRSRRGESPKKAAAGS